MAGSIGRIIVLGFVAGALSVIVFHQGLIWIMAQLGWIAARPWNLTGTVPPYGVPVLLNQCFWGGLWGILIALILRRGAGPVLMLGFVIGVLGPAMTNFIILPLIRGTAMFGGGNLAGIGRTILIGGTFGWGTALILTGMARRGA